MASAKQLSVTVAGVGYSVDLAGERVTIYREGVWAGDGRVDATVEDVRNGARPEIVDCAADLGDEVYDALDEAIQDAMAE